MKKSLHLFVLLLALASVAGWVSPVRAFTLVVEGGDPSPTPPVSAPLAPPAPSVPEEPEEPDEPAEPEMSDSAGEPDAPRHGRHRNGVQDVVFTAGDTAVVAPDQRVQSAVSIFGDVVVRGQVHDAAVAIGGNNRVEGEVHGPAVAIFGNVEVTGHITEGAVAIFGGVKLAPGARVDGEVVSLWGLVDRAEGSTVGGQIVNVGAGRSMPDWSGFHAWLREAAMSARLLTLDSRTAWAWWLALAFLGLHVTIGLIVPGLLSRCAETLEQSPGRTLLATFLAMIAIPLLLLLLTATVIGIPIAGLLLLVFGLVGKAALLYVVGRRFGIVAAPLAVLVGGVLFLLLYLIPVVGLLAYLFGTALGLGIVCHTLIRDRSRSNRAEASRPPARPLVVVPPVPPVTPVPPATPESAAAPEMGSAASAFVSPEPAPAVPPPPIPTPAATSVPDSIFDAETSCRAGFGPRFGASLIDAIVVGIVSSTFGGLFLPLFLIYCTALWALRGSTVGGIICGLRVVRLDGKPVDWVTAVVRALGGLISLIPLGLGYLWVATDKERQSWHDHIAGTTIIHHRSKRGLL